VLVHLPSYAGEISANPELVAEGFHVLHVNPLGYYTPTGPSREDRNWTVLPDTIRSCGERGYVDWSTDAVMAVLWVLSRDDVYSDRFAFFGASQGGGGALLMGSLFAGSGVRAVAADVPFLTGFARYAEGGQDGRGFRSLFGPGQLRPSQWKALGYVDTISHAHRLAMPVLLTAGSRDGACPPETIEGLFERLPGTKNYTLLAGQGHACTVPFIHLARAWFALHV
jgi:cephalosporin-C deacetylase-like acetyl esterase